MKVEIDLGEDQLKLLDEDMTKLLESLSDKQKTKILSDYILNQFDKMETTYKDNWGRDETVLSEFGKQLVRGLQEKIVEVVTTNILENEVAKRIVQENVDAVVKNLDSIIQSSITKYVIENVFTSKERLYDTTCKAIQETTNNLRSEIYRRN